MDTVGASEISALFDCNPYESRYSLWAKKVDLTPPEDFGEHTTRQQIGIDLEQPVLEIWAVREGLAVAHNTKSIRHPELPGLSATPDGLVYRDSTVEELAYDSFTVFQTEATADVKTVRPHQRKAWLDGIPKHYWWQQQQQMLVCNVSHGYLIALFGVDEIAATRIEADNGAHAQIIEAAGIFWKQVRGELPAPTVDDHRATMEALHSQRREPKTIVLPSELIDVSDALAKMSEQMSGLKKAIRGAQNQIIAALGTAECGVWPNGSGFMMKDVVRRGYTTKDTSFKQLTRFKSDDTEGEDDGE